MLFRRDKTKPFNSLWEFTTKYNVCPEWGVLIYPESNSIIVGEEDLSLPKKEESRKSFFIKIIDISMGAVRCCREIEKDKEETIVSIVCSDDKEKIYVITYSYETNTTRIFELNQGNLQVLRKWKFVIKSVARRTCILGSKLFITGTGYNTLYDLNNGKLNFYVECCL